MFKPFFSPTFLLRLDFRAFITITDFVWVADMTVVSYSFCWGMGDGIRIAPSKD